MEKNYVIGVDFGTLSARAVLADAADGRIAAQADFSYAHGVLTQALPDGTALPADGWALQVPADYREALIGSVRGVSSAVPMGAIRAIALDFTSSTVLPVLADGTPLCELEENRSRALAYAMLWKHHAAQPQARELEAYLKKYAPQTLAQTGGRLSSEEYLPKSLQFFRQAPDLAEKTAYFMEAADWIPFLLTGIPARSACCAGFKRYWTPENGDLPHSLLQGFDPDYALWYQRVLRGPVLPIWQPAGSLLPEWAAQLGLPSGIPVGISTIDAHAALLGCGITQERQAMMILGTSGCHILLDRTARSVPGTGGYAEDALLPGYYAYEAGQSCVGDALAWFTEHCVPAAYEAKAREEGLSIHQYLTKLASALRVGQTGLLALDWWNGQRTPFVNDDLRGLMLGMSLQTRPEDQYRALLESLAFGTRLVFDTFAENGVEVDEIRACGGIAHKNALMVQIYADVLNRPIRIVESAQASALGAAIHAAAAAGLHPDMAAAVKAMGSACTKVFLPDAANAAAYEKFYALYREMAVFFAEKTDFQERLRAIRAEAEASL